MFDPDITIRIDMDGFISTKDWMDADWGQLKVPNHTYSRHLFEVKPELERLGITEKQLLESLRGM